MKGEIEIRHTHNDTDTHVELELYIDDDFCGNFVVAKKKLDWFMLRVKKGFECEMTYVK